MPRDLGGGTLTVTALQEEKLDVIAYIWEAGLLQQAGRKETDADE